MNRRAFVTGLGAALAAPLVAEAQQAGKGYRIGVLGIGEPTLMRQSLREAGYVEGQNLSIEWRNSEGHQERLSNRIS